MKGVAQTAYLIELQVLSFLKKLQTVFCAKKKGHLGSTQLFITAGFQLVAQGAPILQGVVVDNQSWFARALLLLQALRTLMAFISSSFF